MDNYEITKKKMENTFLTHNQEEMIKRFDLKSDESYLYFDFIGCECRVNRFTGLVQCKDIKTGEFREANHNEAMTVFDLLCYSKKEAGASGEFVNLKSLSGIHGISQIVDNNFFKKEAKEFDKMPENLKNSIIKLGGKLISEGDISGEFDVFYDLKVRMRFWHSDDEFSPEIQFFWDKNVLQYMHYETVWYANSALVKFLRDTMKSFE